MFRMHFFFDTIGTKRFDRSAYKQPGFIDRIAKRITRITANYKIARLRHKCTHVTNVAMHDKRCQNEQWTIYLKVSAIDHATPTGDSPSTDDTARLSRDELKREIERLEHELKQTRANLLQM